MAGRHKKTRRWCFPLVLISAVAKATLAPVMAQPVQQGAAEIAQEQRRQQERDQVERQRLERAPDVRLPVGEPGVQALLPKNESPCFRLTEFEVVGKDALLFNWLLPSLAGANGADSPVGQCVGAQGISLLIKRAQDALVAKGFVTSRVLAEPQNLASGKLQLTVSIKADGSLDDVEVTRSSGTKVLDNAAVMIVRRSAPYAPFSAEIRKKADVVVITRTWTFAAGDQLSTKE